jgi:hypothetical protein
MHDQRYLTKCVQKRRFWSHEVPKRPANLMVISKRGVRVSSLMNIFYINYICPGKSNPKLDFQELPSVVKVGPSATTHQCETLVSCLTANDTCKHMHCNTARTTILPPMTRSAQATPIQLLGPWDFQLTTTLGMNKHI